MKSVDEKLNELWNEYKDKLGKMLFYDVATESDCRFIKAFCEFILDRVEYQEKMLKFVSEVGEHE